jgi:hypothetical protein
MSTIVEARASTGVPGGHAGSARKIVALYRSRNAERSGSGGRIPTTPYFEMRDTCSR